VTEEGIEAAARFFNDTVQCVGWNAVLEHDWTLKAYNCPVLRKKLKKKEDSEENGTDYEHPKAWDYLT
jgi:hypothetical protein